MRAAARTPSAPPIAPHATSIAFQASPSWDPLCACISSMLAEYSATSTAARTAARGCAPSALSAMNPTTAKAAMLYPLRSTTCQERLGGDVASYTASLVAAQNSVAAVASAIAPQTELDFEDSV